MSEELKMVAGAGGGGGCFRAGTQVQLDGGKTVAIEHLKEGDEILAFDEDGKIHLAKVTKVHYHADPQPILKVKFWRGEVFITPNHWVLNQYGSFVEMGNLTTHDALMDGMGHLRPIIDAELVGYEPVWNLTVEPHHTFIANGIRVHNGGHRDRFPTVAGSGGGGGGSKGGGGARASVEDPDSLQSRAMVSLVDLLGEGQIGGLVNGAKSIYFNDTPLENDDGTRNFQGVSWDFRDGQQIQSPMPAFADIETPTVVSVKVTKQLPAVVTITNPNVDAVRCLVTIPSLAFQDTTTGDTHGTSVSFRFDVSVNGDPYQTLSGDLTITGKTRSRYQRAYYYDLPKYDNLGRSGTTWNIRMTRITDDAATGNIHNDTYFDTFTEIVNAKLCYPNSVICGISIDSAQFNQIPKRAYLVDGLYIKVPSNYDPARRTYSGVWNGTFKVAVSNNPAWILYDVLTSKRYGLGQYITAANIDKSKLYQIGKYCDEFVSNGYGGMEPRFAINTTLSSRVDAFRLITDLCSAFNGMSYWSGGMVGFMQDSPTDPSMIYSQSNVIDGMFSYAGSSRKDRHSVVHVSWNDPKQNYKQVVEYVEDADLVAKYGIRKIETLAFGATSRGQAVRVAKWILYTEAYESDMISFKVGIDSAMVMPGEVVKIHDSNRAGKRMGGRLTGFTRTSATLDSPVVIGNGTSTICIRMPDGTFAERAIYECNTITPISTVTWADPLPSDPVPNAIWLLANSELVPMLARVIGVAQGEEPGQFIISAIEHNPSKYDAIEKGWKLEEPKTSIIDTKTMAAPTDLTFTESQYQVAPGVVGLSLGVSWFGQGVSYEVTWRRDGKYATNWTTVTTGSPMIDIENARAGTYYFKVVAVSPFGVRSQTLTGNHTTQGKTASPGDVGNFAITERKHDLLLTWDAPTDIGAVTFEIRRGQSWDSGTVLTTGHAGTSYSTDESSAGTYHYHIRSIGAGGGYCDNVASVSLKLAAPQEVSQFNCVQSSSRIDFRWLANPETNINCYEIREGASWNVSTLIAQVNATTYTIPAGQPGDRMFWIKAIASPDIYSDVAVMTTTAIAHASDTNIILSTNQTALAFPGYRIKMAAGSGSLTMANDVKRSEYIFPVDLGSSYTAQNTLYGSIDSVVPSTQTWATAGFAWNSNDANKQWISTGAYTSVSARYQIARFVGALRADAYDSWRFNGTPNSFNGIVPAQNINSSYGAGRYESQGLFVGDMTTIDWNVSMQTTFNVMFWITPSGKSDANYWRVTGAGGIFLRLTYSLLDGAFHLDGSDGKNLVIPYDFAAGDNIAIGIVQTASTRRFMIGRMGDKTQESAEVAATPIGTFTKLCLY